ncbi:Primase, C-terminal 2 [uncultured Caudovirales phage]|uniref:Primase, C-terminal 2 n=1 Tax=uncultured Caudovirales phage TaxID=2100421 RepID=A0A6J5NV76_9CAUD|nr:Primase, C-terminal 2 [uncultured Caudovirales phage]
MMDTKPIALSLRPEAIPESLTSIPRWLLWKYIKKKKPDGTVFWTKVPFQCDGTPASTTNPATWCSYEEALDAWMVGDFDGIGMTLGADVQGIDLDDCRDPETGELSELAKEVLDRIDGYAEVSPSGTGIKLFAKTNLDGSRTKKEMGVELYREGRYFTVTGQAMGGGHDDLSDEVQALDWLIERVWGESMSGLVLTGDAADLELALYRAPLEDWDIERVRDEIAPYLDLEMHYEDWIRVGQALYHQFDGDEEAFELWDEMFQDSSKYGGEAYGRDRWKSFKTQRSFGRGPVTLASVIKMVKGKRDEVKRTERDKTMASLMDAVEATTDPRDLQEKVAAKVANDGDLSDVEREQVAAAIQSKAKTLGVKLEIATVRGWVRARVKGTGGFIHLNDDGHPLCTLENFRTLVEKLQWTIRYNVIKKAIEILIPGESFTRDNRDNAALACMLSECEKVRMPTKHIAQYLIRVADENQYNPVATWILSREWDGVSRLDQFFATVKSPVAIKDKLMRKWGIQAVAAAFSPDGIAAQGILTFVGPQNIGKTTWFRKLVPDELDSVLTGHTLDLKSKDSIFIALTYWIVELGELDATFKKSEVSAMKAFITQPQDKLRRPYAAVESNFGRRTVFGGSVNGEEFLADPTGNRRYLTIPVEGFEFDHSVDMQQVWAEFHSLWMGGEAFFLSMDEVSELNTHNEQFTIIDPLSERIASSFGWGPHVVMWDWMTVTDVLMKIGIREPTKGQTIAGSAIIRRLNGGQRKRSNGRVLLAVPDDLNDFLG